MSYIHSHLPHSTAACSGHSRRRSQQIDAAAAVRRRDTSHSDRRNRERDAAAAETTYVTVTSGRVGDSTV